MLHQVLPRVGCRTFLSICLSGLVLAACSDAPQDNAPAATADQAAVAPVVDAAQACTALAGLKIAASAIGLPTTGADIVSAELVAAAAEGNANGEYCKVLGAIHPVDYTAPAINFEVNLPSSWNGKTLQFGGGGLNGSLVSGLGRYVKQPDSETTPLARGYVTLGSDSGHQSGGGFDGTFYLNEEALMNFGHMQIKKTHDVAQWLVMQRYGQAPQYDYFMGGSQGGHEGFDAVQRFPDDYDGVVAGYPAHNVIMLHLSALNYARALAVNDGAGWLSPEEISYFTGVVYERCDALDGAADGIISNVQACAATNAPLKEKNGDNPVRCAFGMDTGSACLSDAQIDALNVMDMPYDLGFSLFNDDERNSIFPKWAAFEGSTFMDGGASNLGVEGPETALQRAPGVATNGLAVAKDLTLDVMNDFDPKRYAGRLIEVASKMSANSVAIDRYRDKGGKLIFFHGTVDDFIPVYSSIQYYERLLQRYGQDGADAFVRFYTVPGMGHVTGVFNARIASLEALEAWVERGEALVNSWLLMHTRPRPGGHAPSASIRPGRDIMAKATSISPPALHASPNRKRFSVELKVLLTVFATVFIAELGDKTQLATMLFASDKDVSKWVVFAGASLALIATSALGVLAGGLVSGLVTPRQLQLVAGAGFIAIGLWTLVKS